ncbi:hypothetical protein ID866_11583, partial [Astraeus odoratus]
MSSGNKNAVPVNWQEVPDKELGLDKANPEDVAMAKLQEKFQHKQVREAKEVKKRREAEEAKKRACEAEVWRQEAAAIERQREAERAKEAKKRQRTESKAGPSGARGQEPKRMGKVVEELWGLRKGVATMAESNRHLAQVLYHGFQSVDTLVDEVQIFGAEGFLPKPAPESEPAEDELQETLREVKKLQEERLEWAMERLQMRKEWMWQEEAALTK